MNRNDQQAIENLFGKLAQVEQQSPQRDGLSEDFIRQRIASQPGAPYYMAQTIVVQEQALEAAQRRIQELEGGNGVSGVDAPPRSSAFGSVPRVGRPDAAAAPAAPPSPWNRGGGGGGFLAGAASTAMGVAGGMLLGNALAGLFGGDTAQAAEPTSAANAAGEPAADDAGFDDGGFDDSDF